MADKPEKGDLVLLIWKAPVWILGKHLDEETIEAHLRFDQPLYSGKTEVPRIKVLDGSEHKLRGPGPTWIPIYGEEKIKDYLSKIGLDSYIKFLEMVD
jgi:hypothetical protein